MSSNPLIEIFSDERAHFDAIAASSAGSSPSLGCSTSSQVQPQVTKSDLFFLLLCFSISWFANSGLSLTGITLRWPFADKPTKAQIVKERPPTPEHPSSSHSSSDSNTAVNSPFFGYYKEELLADTTYEFPKDEMRASDGLAIQGGEWSRDKLARRSKNMQMGAFA